MAMPKYKAIFTNGEKRELIVEASEFREGSAVVRFLKQDESRKDGTRTVALVPTDKLLYVVEVTE